jgi:putative nucleotidyltransferase with HDIG domain
VLGLVNKVVVREQKTSVAPFSPTDESFLTALAGQTAIAIENARLYEDVRGLSMATIRSLATAIDARDPYTHGHSVGVEQMAMQLARELGWRAADIEILEFAALLHDVGKIAVPDAILRKAEPLTPDDWGIIRLHPYHSAQIVKPVEPLKRIIPWVYHHHERWDGKGYPDGVKGENIPLAARIIAVADTFNAMTTDRPYRKAFSVAAAVAEIKRCAGDQFDPAMVEAFLRIMAKC